MPANVFVQDEEGELLGQMKGGLPRRGRSPVLILDTKYLSWLVRSQCASNFEVQTVNFDSCTAG